MMVMCQPLTIGDGWSRWALSALRERQARREAEAQSLRAF